MASANFLVHRGHTYECSVARNQIWNPERYYLTYGSYISTPDTNWPSLGMNQKKLLQHTSKENNAISPIIATLLLILIAIAAGVVVYAYVIGFVGNTTGSSGGNQSLITIDNFCASANLQKCNSGADYSIVVRNVGTTAFTLSPTSAAQVYFTDVTGGGATASDQCTASGTVNPGSVYTCSSPTWPLGFTPNPGDTINVKVVNPDGGQAPATTKAIS